MELLIKGATVYLQKSNNPNRKTAYDLISVVKTLHDGIKTIVNIDSQIPNHCVSEWLPQSQLFPSDTVFKRETTFLNSRFDFSATYNNTTAYIEVKGVTLENNGEAMFPDAPTTRGVKHINELTHCAKNGIPAYVIFVIQMEGTHSFSPNTTTDPAFAKALKKAKDAGVNILALDCTVTKTAISINKPIKTIIK